MDYLRTLGSALVQKSGLNLPFNLGQKVASFDGACTLYDATKRDDGSLVSVFEFDFSESPKKPFKPFAQNAVRKLRTTRHPDVLKFFDAVETDSALHIMTERVKPLQPTLSSWSSRKAPEREDWLLWGLHRISVALAFLNDTCASTHGKVYVDSIFITPSGEWKLGGFELLSTPKDDAAVLYTMGSIFPAASALAPPEVKNRGWTVIKESDPASADGYALGILLHTIFNPSHPPLTTLSPPHPPPSGASRGSMPSSVFNSFKRLLNPNPKNRLTPKQFLESGMAESGFFKSNRLVKVCIGLDNFTLGNETEKIALLRTLKESASSFPPEFASYRVLPSLVSALEYGGASAATILPLVLQLGTNVTPEDYTNAIIAPLVKLFSSPDRGTRMALLDHLNEYVDKLDKKTVSDKIWPHLQTGFSDTVAVIREATTKSIVQFAPKLNDRILNNDLLRLLAKMQTDPEASIRTNTCILIGRLGPTLGYNTKRKVLVPAFIRALKDSFVHARVAGLTAFMTTIDCFEIEDIASRVIPNVSPALIDKEKIVRDQAFKTIDLFIKRLESHATKMPDTDATDASDVPSGNLPDTASLVNSAAGAAGALAGWAITSLGRRLAASDLQSTINPGAGALLERPSGSVDPNGGLTTIVVSPSNVLETSQTSKVKGMQLGQLGNKQTNSDVFEQFESEITDDLKRNPWDNDDLIDINADQDDWGTFETAPTVIELQGGINTLVSPLASPRSGEGRLQSISRRVGSPTSRQKSLLISKQTLPVSPSGSRVPTPVSSPRPDKINRDEELAWDDTEKHDNGSSNPAVSSLVGLTKEEKATELARRKEERKQRIAQLKEQKRNACKT